MCCHGGDQFHADLPIWPIGSSDPCGPKLANRSSPLSAHPRGVGEGVRRSGTSAPDLYSINRPLPITFSLLVTSKIGCWIRPARWTSGQPDIRPSFRLVPKQIRPGLDFIINSLIFWTGLGFVFDPIRPESMQ